MLRRALRLSSVPARWLVMVLCLDAAWLGFVRLPLLLGRGPWLGLSGQDDWIPELIAMLLVPVEIYLAWLFFARQYREKLGWWRTSYLMNKVLNESTPWRWATDAAGRFTYCGPESLQLVGYEPSELIGHHFSRTIDPSDLAGVLQDRNRRTDATGAWTGVRTIYRHRLGSRVMVDVSARACLGAEGQYLGLEGETRSLRPGTMNDSVAAETRRRVKAVMDERLLLTAFQPVWSLSSGKVIGVEALTRFPGSPASPDAQFRDADSVGLGVELEMVALETALDAARALPNQLYVAVNLSPDACLDPRLPAVLARAGFPGERLVLEVTERHAVQEYGPLGNALESLRRSGLRIAVDDAGAGFASMRHILELSPDLIKLDRDVIAGIDSDPARQALGTAMVGFAAGLGATLVAEGIETTDELATVTGMGMHAGQGYLLGRPSLDPDDWASWAH
ncbi:EAL domain-containing protein [Pseudarthrobacter equi]|uniref:sensor domain-containing phosphodiesterase n=1 Tax=Pseudarthrobacter TaxID=1742993 RepID=UPI0015849FD9|nr:MULTISPECIES: EAL domain-containing protein [Pseudarthrobacter]MCT9625986.1 EAL domain-containing protein [Pseudarthrobacter equi]NUT72161.1 EAL domain-containing protein [Pseudarthrobacter sp. C4D7]